MKKKKNPQLFYTNVWPGEYSGYSYPQKKKGIKNK